MRNVTTKVDVFSFGIVVMEFLTKRRPTGLNEEHGLPVSLRQLVEKAVSDGIKGILQITDPTVVPKQQEEVLQEVYKLALVCTYPNPEDRPNMNEVLSTLLRLRKMTECNDDEHFPAEE